MKLGKNTIKFKNPVYIRETYSLVGPNEGMTRFGSYFDEIIDNKCNTHNEANQTYERGNSDRT